ncbi:glycosyltransferase [Paraglaciecola sp.]|uniref:glycosyltransferase family 2 protein n=1 Tax=Paraglaciecola sp. TaxID=1920173 RepID=UPI003264F04D
MKAEPYFSVVIPVYNRVDSLKRALVSVIRQDFSDFEVIVVDDGSTAKFALEITTMVNALGGSKIQLIRYEKNINGAYARNVGIEASLGKYVCFLDSDDEWDKNKLSEVYSYTKKRNVKFVYHQCRIASGKVIPDKGIASDELFTEYCFVRNQRVGAPTSTITICRQLALDSLFDSSLTGHQDWDFCLKLEAKGIQFNFLEKAMCTRHKSSQDSVGQNISFEYSLDFFNQRREFFTIRSASYFHWLTLLPKAIKELSLSEALFRSKYFWFMFYFLRVDGFKAVLIGLRKVFILKRRLKLLKRKISKLNGHIFIYGDNYYGRLVNEGMGKEAMGFLDSLPLRDFCIGKPVKPISYLNKIDVDQVAAIILATDNHYKIMTNNILEYCPSLKNKIICF